MAEKKMLNDNTVIEGALYQDITKYQERFLELIGVLSKLIGVHADEFLLTTPLNEKTNIRCLFLGLNIKSIFYIDVRINQLMNSTHNVSVLIWLINHPDGQKIKIFEDLRFEKAYLVTDFTLKVKFNTVDQNLTNQYVIEEFLKSMHLDHYVNHHKTFRLNLLKYGKWVSLLKEYVDELMKKQSGKFEEIDDEKWYKDSKRFIELPKLDSKDSN